MLVAGGGLRLLRVWLEMGSDVMAGVRDAAARAGAAAGRGARPAGWSHQVRLGGLGIASKPYALLSRFS